MTVYTTIADSEIDPESPGTTTLFTKLRNNPIAITEGASGAPRMVRGAFTEATAGTTYQQKWIGDWSTTVTTGYAAAQVTRDEGGNVRLCTAIVSGEITVRYTFDNVGSGLPGYVRILKNGTSVHTHTGSTLITNTADITVAVGDTLHMQGYNDGGTLEITDISIRTANDVIAVS